MELADLAAVLASRAARTALVDGRSGAGKSTFAARLGALWPAATILHLEDIYPGWDGLDRAREHLIEHVLRPRAAGRPATWQSWDWATDSPSGWHPVDPDAPLLIEGVGALNAESRALADAGIWIDAPDDLRRDRALARDGDTYTPHWERWAAQERAYIERHDPRASADYIVLAAADGITITERGTE